MKNVNGNVGKNTDDARMMDTNEARIRAFTLIEIMVAMAILVIVIASTLAIFRTSAISWRKGEIRAQRYQQARFILQRMSREIASIIPVSLAGPFCLGTANQFYFICSVTDAPSALVEVGYWLDQEAEQLMRSYQSFPDYDFSSFEQEDVLSENVAALSFQYSDGETWLENWDSRPEANQQGLLPKAVKIEFDIKEEKGERIESFSTVVTLPTSKE